MADTKQWVKKVTENLDRYCSTIDWLPVPPEELVDDLDRIPELRENMMASIVPAELYESYNTGIELEQYYQQYFDYDIVCRYQIIHKEIGVHVDYGIEDYKYNYLFDTGGTVATHHWTSVEDPQLLNTTYCDQGVWYELNVAIPHSISKPDSTRYSLVIRKK
jgi:hypothetical protein